MTRPAARLVLVLSLVAGGCATPAATSRFPSLLPRAIETRSDAEPETAPAVAVAAADPATDARIAALRKTYDDTAASFATAAATAERSAAAAKDEAVGSERWLAAQSALADLDVLRATTSATLTEIDDLSIARASEGQPPYPALEALHAEVQRGADAQTARIAAIQARLPQI